MQYRLSFYVPKSDIEDVKNAVFKTGAGTQGEYKQACWQVIGQGQFMPLSNARPAIGQVNHLEKVEEYKVEILCTENNIRQAVNALKEAHPYEEPAYSVIKLEPF